MSTRIESLANFVVVADEGNITKAARKLHIAQPTLSRQLMSLEEEFGHELYERREGTVALTEEGRILYDYAKVIGDAYSRAKSAMDCGESSLTGTVYLGYGETQALDTVFHAMALTRERYQGVSFHLTLGDTNELIEQVNRGSLDFMLECSPRSRRRYETYLLPGKDTWAFAVGSGSPLYSRTTITPSDLENADVVVSRQVLNSGRLKEWAGAHYHPESIAVTFNLGTTIAGLVARGAGICLVYREMMEPLVSNKVKILPLDPPIYDESGLSWRKGRALTPVASAFLEVVRSCSEEGSGPA
jgi:DNA-binding transcriptional LysR family regulator